MRPFHDCRDSRRGRVVSPAGASRARALGLLVVAAVATWRPAAASTPATLQIDVRGDRITVRARQVPLEDALAAIANRLGAEVRGHVAGPRTVDVEFEDVALPDGFARLLGRESFALVYGGAATVRRIYLLGGPDDIGAAHADVASAAIAAPAPADLPLAPPPRRLGRSRPTMAGAHPVYGPSLARAPQARTAHQGAAMRPMLRAILADESFMKSIRAGEIPLELAARIATSGASETAKANAAAALRSCVVPSQRGSSPGRTPECDLRRMPGLRV